MAVRSIVDIEIDDSAFTKFRAAFKEYQSDLKSTPSAWKKITDSISGSSAAVEMLADRTQARQTNAKLTAEAEKSAADSLHRATSETDRQERSWRDMARSTKSFASHIGDATSSLLRWGALTGLISGLVGAGGLFGIERLAQSAAGQRSSTGGLNLTPGDQKAFGLNFGRVLGSPNGFLTGVYESLTDVTKAAPYGALGLNYGNERQKGTADAAIDVLRGLKTLADRTPEAQLGTTFSSRGLEQFGISVEDFQRIKNRPLAELEGYFAQNGRDRNDLNLNQGQLKAWEDFKFQLDRAKNSIENDLIKGLEPLTPVLGRLSDAFVRAANDFANSSKVHEWFTEIGQVFDQLIVDFKTIGSYLHKIFGNVFSGPGGSPYDDVGPGGAPGLKSSPGGPDVGPGGASGGFNIPSWLKGPSKPSGGTSGGSGADWNYVTPGAYRPGNFSDTGISPLLLASVEYQESRGRDVTNARSGAAGYFQFMPATARQYGVDVHNEQSSLDGARRYLSDLAAEFGSTEKALAAYNWGPGNLRRDMERYGNDWRAHLPAETQQYISSVLGRTQQNSQFKDRSVQVKIHNNTGGNANVSVNQMATA